MIYTILKKNTTVMRNKFITKIVNNVNNSIKKTIMFQAQICIMLCFMIKNILECTSRIYIN